MTNQWSNVSKTELAGDFLLNKATWSLIIIVQWQLFLQTSYISELLGNALKVNWWLVKQKNEKPASGSDIFKARLWQHTMVIKVMTSSRIEWQHADSSSCCSHR